MSSKLMNDMREKILLRNLQAEDGQVWSHVLTIVLVAVLAGAIVIQCGPIIWNHISIHGTADDAAQEAAITYANSRGDMDRVHEVVRELLDRNNAKLNGPINVIQGQNGEPDLITVSIRKIVNTSLFENVGYLCKYTEAHAYSERVIP